MNDSGINPSPTDPTNNDDPPRAEVGALARRLNALFVEKQVSNKQVAAALTAAGIDITHGYLSLLRRGLRDNPSHDKLHGLADYFGVTTDFFTGPDPQYRDDEVADVMAIAAAERIRAIAHHASGLSPESLDNIHRMIAMARKAEGLAPVESEVSPADQTTQGPEISSSENSTD